MHTPTPSLLAAYQSVRAELLAEQTAEGYWVGELSSSALATAVALVAFAIIDRDRHQERIELGKNWLKNQQNPDGGWGDTSKSFSNISTTMLVRSAFALTADATQDAPTIDRVESYLNQFCGTTPPERAAAIRNRYGSDRTFSVPILLTSSLAGLVPWHEVPRLPFELACLPQSWYRFARLPVVSYALPALIAIGQCIHHFRGGFMPLRRVVRQSAFGKSWRVLRTIQPSSGGYLEATPLTAFVAMSLAAMQANGRPLTEPALEVLHEAERFLIASMRPDGSWPIDTDLSIWLTTLSINALANESAFDPADFAKTRDWILSQQTTDRHPFTGAAPGGWGWSHCPGSVPDCDDTPGAILALMQLGTPTDDPALQSGERWVRQVQNRDGGFPTFCRGWGALPFDRSGADLTAHALRALSPNDSTSHKRGFAYLRKQQRPDGSWLPLWFGNQSAPDDVNPVYGTARVLAAYRDQRLTESPECQHGVAYLASVQNPDGGWGGAAGCPSTVEETALVVELFATLKVGIELEQGIAWLVAAIQRGEHRDPKPIGFYFAKLWYFEKLYPLIFAVGALGRVVQIRRSTEAKK